LSHHLMRTPPHHGFGDAYEVKKMIEIGGRLLYNGNLWRKDSRERAGWSFIEKPCGRRGPRAGEETMPGPAENLVYLKASKCAECITQAVRSFDELLEEGKPFQVSDYYRARNLLRDGEQFFQEALKNAKKLLGPSPSYVSGDYKQWRDTLLEEFHILAMGREYTELRTELAEDGFLRKWMNEEEMESMLRKHFQSQQTGKRKLANIKVRMILDFLEDKISEAKDLNRKATQKQQETR